MRADVINLSLGLEGFTVLDTIEDEGQVEILIELAAGAGICPRCAGVSTAVHERRESCREVRRRMSYSLRWPEDDDGDSKSIT